NAADDNQANAQGAENEQENEMENEQEAEVNDQQAAENENEQEANDQADDNAAQTPATDVGTTTEAEARTIAMNAMPGKTIKKVETENEHSGRVFSVRFTDNSRVDINGDGAIVRTRDRSLEKSNSGSGSSH